MNNETIVYDISIIVELMKEPIIIESEKMIKYTKNRNVTLQFDQLTKLRLSEKNWPRGIKILVEQSSCKIQTDNLMRRYM